jgi:hypothetical protein
MITKSHNHNHFWIEDNTVYESYNTLRGLRYRPIAEVIMEDLQYRITKKEKTIVFTPIRLIDQYAIYGIITL